MIMITNVKNLLKVNIKDSRRTFRDIFLFFIAGSDFHCIEIHKNTGFNFALRIVLFYKKQAQYKIQWNLPIADIRNSRHALNSGQNF